jgi:hypothetical protein
MKEGFLIFNLISREPGDSPLAKASIADQEILELRIQVYHDD